MSDKITHFRHDESASLSAPASEGEKCGCGQNKGHGGWLLCAEKGISNTALDNFPAMVAASREQAAGEGAPPEGRPIHRTVPLLVWADIDEGIADMVRYLNTIPGVRTEASCQGTIGEGGPNPYRAQVMVTWNDPAIFERLRKEFDYSETEPGENVQRGWCYLHPRDGWKPPVAQPSASQQDNQSNSDGPCKECGFPCEVWFAPNDIWNELGTTGLLCIRCFIAKFGQPDSGEAWLLKPEFYKSDIEKHLEFANEQLRRAHELLESAESECDQLRQRIEKAIADLNVPIHLSTAAAIIARARISLSAPPAQGEGKLGPEEKKS
jgi:hypothetical protein